eukprot:SAG31_NODE_18996_length_615_cov_1.000000_1_plen_112_part_01
MLGPVASSLCGIAVGLAADQLLLNPVGALVKQFFTCDTGTVPTPQASQEHPVQDCDKEETSKIDIALKPLTDKIDMIRKFVYDVVRIVHRIGVSFYDQPAVCLFRIAVGVWL